MSIFDENGILALAMYTKQLFANQQLLFANQTIS